ncbi:MAG TPA: type 4a pilus biogenesis protein PilO [Armatimonadota bacterium]|nr:type 4a pilus biogenesis protein PilO [Armatimonadota bacterium]
MKVTARDQKVLIIGLIAVVAIVGWMYVVSPMQQRWSGAKDKLSTGEEALDKLSGLAGERDRYAEDRRRVAEMIREIDELDSSQTVVPALINEVQTLGQVHGIQITRYEPLPARVEDAYSAHSLSLNFRTSLPSLVGFVRDLQNARPVIAVRRMHVTPPGPNSETQDLSVELLLSTFAIEALGDAQADEDDTVLVAEVETG